MSALAARLWLVSIIVRVLATGILFFGPWADSPDELAGWDIERFHEIAEAEGQPYIDFEVEYPPGSVVMFEGLSKPLGSPIGVVGMHRALLVLSLVADLATAGVILLIAGARSAKTYLLLGLPLVPMGLLRLDLVAAFFASAAFWALVRPPGKTDDRNNNSDRFGSNTRLYYLRGALYSYVIFAVSVTSGAMIKIWPGLVVAAAVSLRRISRVGVAITALAISGTTWLLWAGDGLAPVEQVLSLRGASGWHVESTPGSIVALFSTSSPRLELNAFRIGTLVPPLVFAGRVLSVGSMFGLIIVGLARTKSAANTTLTTVQVGAVVSLGCTASLLVTAPLLSPQFILWLTPWAALLASAQRSPEQDLRYLIYLTGAIAVVTGATLAIFGPSGVADTVPAALLVLRNLALAGLVGLCFQALRRTKEN